MTFTNHTLDHAQLSTEMDQYKIKEDVLKMGIVDPELEEVI